LLEETSAGVNNINGPPSSHAPVFAHFNTMAWNNSRVTNYPPFHPPPKVVINTTDKIKKKAYWEKVNSFLSQDNLKNWSEYTFTKEQCKTFTLQDISDSLLALKEICTTIAQKVYPTSTEIAKMQPGIAVH